MLQDVGEHNTYPIYSLLCQTAHGGHYSTWIFRGNGVGALKTRGNFITEENGAYHLLLLACLQRTSADFLPALCLGLFRMQS